ncbi:MAG: class I SAM-dependent methyltransferase [Chloroflexi bacterium]|nr:class I SAM-dependent methyltransferase [Chloroflexota bacterium]
MKTDTIETLAALNRQFYQTFALQFSATRARLQPGVRRVLASLPLDAAVLDLGCGNGELARALAERGQRGGYLGLDASAGLLAEAQKRALPSYAAAFIQADLAAADWDDLPALRGARFDAVFAFAVLHHLPGVALRLAALRKARALLATDGRFTFSVWQFLNSPRWQGRILPWARAGLADGAVEPGDYLLDWRQGGEGLRYLHHFSLEELDALAQSSGFRCLESFHSDGHSGRLGLYQTWEAF